MEVQKILKRSSFDRTKNSPPISTRNDCLFRAAFRYHTPPAVRKRQLVEILPRFCLRCLSELISFRAFPCVFCTSLCGTRFNVCAKCNHPAICDRAVFRSAIGLLIRLMLALQYSWAHSKTMFKELVSTTLMPSSVADEDDSNEDGIDLSQRFEGRPLHCHEPMFGHDRRQSNSLHDA